MNDELLDSEKKADATPRTQAEKAAQPAEQDFGRRPKFEFKIKPVDPKNSFDFEDVADK
jgi:hypothetical protein